MRVELLFDQGDELVGAVIDAHVEPWVARALAHHADQLDTGEDHVVWAEADVSHLWWKVPAPGDDWTLQTCAKPGPGLTECTHLSL